MGASVPDQALVPTASSRQGVSTEGFDPSRGIREQVFERLQQRNGCGPIVCADYLSENCVCMDEFLAAQKAEAYEDAAHCAEHLNGWGFPPSPELADHIAKCIRDLAQGYLR